MTFVDRNAKNVQKRIRRRLQSIHISIVLAQVDSGHDGTKSKVKIEEDINFIQLVQAAALT